MTEKLKPCPFCGRAPHINQYGQVYCETDDCEVQSIICNLDDWNRRAPLTVSDALEVSEVRALVEWMDNDDGEGDGCHCADCGRHLLEPFLAAMEMKR